MKIKQVEELVGITSKNIRFYENQGLLNPNRSENGYRDYKLSDVENLKKIKLLRKLDVPIEEIKLVISEQETLADCMEKTTAAIHKKQADILKMEAFANKILEEKASIKTIECDIYLDEIENMEKEGVGFVDVNKTDIHKRKKAGAIGGGLVMILFFAAMIALIIWCKMDDPAMPMAFAMIFVVAFIGIIAAIIAVIKSRLKEIDGGEEDEASKY